MWKCFLKGSLAFCFLLFCSIEAFSQEKDFNKFIEVGSVINITNREFSNLNNRLAFLNQPTFNSLGTGVALYALRGVGNGWLVEGGVIIGDTRRKRTDQVVNSLDYSRLLVGVGKLININSKNRLYPMVSPSFGSVNFNSRERVNQNFNQLALPGSQRPITEMATSVIGLDLSINYDIIRYSGVGDRYDKTGFSIGYHTALFYFERNGMVNMPTMNPGGFFISIKDSVFLSRFN